MTPAAPPQETTDFRFGPRIRDGRIRFRFWAPRQHAPRLAVEGRDEVAMTPVGDGWFEAEAEGGPGLRYRFALDDGLAVPDPASRRQPDDVHGPSEVVDPAAFAWSDGEWRGRSWHEAVIYELHVGSFTPEGTFRAAAARLADLAGLGVTVVEVMPVADFPGRRNWGYDGVLPFAPDASYGHPDDFKAFVDAAHALGLMVILDVVYNHFGPDGNYLPLYAPIFTTKHRTPWGEAVNVDDEGSADVREFIVENALHWVRDFHLDGLRLDAVHEIRDDSPVHILDEMRERLRAAVPHRPVHLVLENEENDAGRLAREDGVPTRFTAQWNDDVHHVLHVALSGEADGYYADYAGRTDLLGRAIAEGFAFQGAMMPYRGAPRGEPSGDLSPDAFVAFLQNHDQIGNRAFGDRITSIAPPQAVRAAHAVLLLAPQVPMIFQGEEWGTQRPFPFFCDFSGDLAEAVREGRRGEFARFPAFADPERRAMIPDPLAEETFLAAKLDWSERERPPHREALEFMRAILAVRRRAIVPLIPALGRGGSFEVLGPGAIAAEWSTGDGRRLALRANLSADACAAPAVGTESEVLWREGEVETERLGAWAAEWRLSG